MTSKGDHGNTHKYVNSHDLCMANITLSIDKSIHDRMKNHPEIKWTEIVRKAILDFLVKIEEPDCISSGEFWAQLDEETRDNITYLREHIDFDEELAMQKKLHAMEQERIEKQLRIERGEE